MGNSRVIYRHWITSITASPAESEKSEFAEQINEAVRAAIEQLEPNERIVIERYYLQFEEMSSIADGMGISLARATTLHLRAIGRLRKLLASFAKENFGIAKRSATRCPLCRSPYRAEIDELIRGRDPRRPWRILLQQLRREFGIRVRSYHAIVSHQRFH